MVATCASPSHSQSKACGSQRYVPRWDRSIFDNVVTCCPFRKSGVNDTLSPCNYLVLKVALVSADIMTCTLQLFISCTTYASVNVEY